MSLENFSESVGFGAKGVQMVRRLVLNERLDSVAAESLRNELAESEGEDLVLDASTVNFVGGLCLELLMCAAQVWETAGRTFRFEAASEEFVENLARFGLRPADIGEEVSP